MADRAPRVEIQGGDGFDLLVPLADLLVQKGYEVHGIIRRASTFNTARIDSP